MRNSGFVTNFQKKLCLAFCVSQSLNEPQRINFRDG